MSVAKSAENNANFCAARMAKLIHEPSPTANLERLVAAQTRPTLTFIFRFSPRESPLLN